VECQRQRQRQDKDARSGSGSGSGPTPTRCIKHQGSLPLIVTADPAGLRCSNTHRHTDRNCNHALKDHHTSHLTLPHLTSLHLTSPCSLFPHPLPESFFCALRRSAAYSLCRSLKTPAGSTITTLRSSLRPRTSWSQYPKSLPVTDVQDLERKVTCRNASTTHHIRRQHTKTTSSTTVEIPTASFEL